MKYSHDMAKESKRIQQYCVWSDVEYGEFSPVQFIGVLRTTKDKPQYEYHATEYGYFNLNQFLGVMSWARSGMRQGEW